MITENALFLWWRNPARAWLIVGLSLAGLCVRDTAAQGGPCSHAWKDPVNGSFADAGRWDHGPPPPIGRPECQGAPRVGDIVSLRQGTYTVSIVGVQSSLLAEFGTVGPPPFAPHDVTFDMQNAWTIGQLFSAGTMRVTGDDSLGVGEFFIGDRANFILDGGRASFSKVGPGTNGPPAPTKQFVVKGEKARLTTSGPFGVFSAEVDGGQWTHTGVAGTFRPATLLLKNGAVFTAGVIDFGSSGNPLMAESGSLFSIGDLKGGTVMLSSGGRMNNTDVTNVREFGSPSSVSGTGSIWTITGGLRMTDAFNTVNVAAGGFLSCGTLLMDDFGSTLNVKDAGSRLAAGTIELGIAERGNLSAQSGGRVETQAVFIGGKTSGHGNATVSGANSTLAITLGTFVGDSGQGSLSIGPGGVVQLGTPSGFAAGFDTTGRGTVTVNGANAFLDVRGAEAVIGKGGTGSLRITERGVAFAQDLIIGELAGSDGSVEVSQVVGTQTTLQVNGLLSVGRKGKGALLVGGPAVGAPGDRARAATQSLSAGGSVNANTVRVLGAGARLDVADTIKIGDGGTATMTLSTGAMADCRQLLIGLDPALSLGKVEGNIQLVSPQTVFTVRERLNVGQSDIGTLLIRDGSRLEFSGDAASECDAGTTRNGRGAIAVTGANALLAAPNAIMTVGREGDGSLEISKGGRVSSHTARLGSGDFADGVVVVGNKDGDMQSTATWEVADRLEVGLNGFGVLYVLEAGVVRAASACLGCTADSQGDVLVTGSGSLTLSGGLTVGLGARTPACALGVDNGAVVTVNGPILEAGVGAESQTLIAIALAGSALNAPAAETRLGVNGYARAEVSLGGQLTTGAATLGIGLPSTGIVYIGTGSKWQVNGPLTVGVLGETFLTVDDGGLVTVAGPMTTNDRAKVSGTGRIITQSLANNGTLNPGGSAGTLEITGSFIQGSNATLEMEIAGTTAGLLHDVLKVNGNTTLAGNLNIRFINGFAPAAGQIFALLNVTGTVTGAFGAVSVTGLAPGFQFGVRPTADGRGLELAALTAGTAATKPEAPTLTIERFGPHAVVSWTALTSGYFLQSTTDLHAATWTTRTTAHRLFVPELTGAEFFRLARP